MKKIMFVATDANLSGASLCLISLVKDFRNKGYNTLVIIPKNGDIEIELKKYDINYLVVKSYPWVVLKEKSFFKKQKIAIKFFVKYFLNLFAIRKLKKIIKKEKINVVHINSLFSYVGAIAAKKCKIKLVWHIREILEYGHQAKFFNEKSSYSLINKSDFIITISEYVNNYYSKFLDNSKMHIVYDGLDVDKYYNPTKEIFKEPIIKFLLAGTIQKSKGQEEFIKALSLLKKSNYKNFKATLIGYSTSKSKTNLLKLIEELDLVNEVEYLGFKENVCDYWNETDIAFMCSTGEAFGRTTIEAKLSGCLIIGAAAGGTKELIFDKKDGLLYEVNSPEDLMEKIKFALDNIKLSRKIAKDGQTKAKKEFNSDLTTKKVIELYNKYFR